MEELIKDVYELILRVANQFLTQSEKYPIELLAIEDPSYQDVANLIDSARLNIHDAMDAWDPHLADQANEYCRLMLKMARAIGREDEADLENLCAELRRKPFVMPH